MLKWCWSCGCFSCQCCQKLAKAVNFCWKYLILLMQSMPGSVLPLAIVSWQRWYQILKMFNDVTFEDPRERFAVCFRWVSGDEAIWETRELQCCRRFIAFLLLMISYCPWDDEVWILEESWLDFYEEILRGWGSLLSHSRWGNRGRTGRSHLGSGNSPCLAALLGNQSTTSKRILRQLQALCHLYRHSRALALTRFVTWKQKIHLGGNASE